MSGGVTTRGLVGEVDSAFPIKLQTKKFITVMWEGKHLAQDKLYYVLLNQDPPGI